MLIVLHIGTGSGHRPAARFLLGHLADLMWALLALIALRADASHWTHSGSSVRRIRAFPLMFGSGAGI
ncbi:hypothetical protein ACIP93_27700 [Streptomyces sp. NPDC088745]|uniref:hypothetical protein n=1 Tax=Streptomyces sp. NPDC088745 TaxID=3365884 RepID=UPI00381C8749